MNLFEIMFIDVVLLIFPMLVYLIYLSTDRNINDKSKKIYNSLALLTSFFLVYRFGINDKIISSLIAILILNSIVFLSYLDDNHVIGEIILIMIVLVFYPVFNNTIILLAGCTLISILNILIHKVKKIFLIELSLVLSSIIYYFWIVKYNNSLFNNDLILSIIISYIFIVNIICFMYQIGKKILKSHLDYKELEKEKQIRLSLFKITHEIKNPIAVCKGYLDMINVKDEKQVERYIPIIKSEIERLLSILQDFLSINKDNLHLDIMDINMLIEETIKKFDPMFNHNKIKINLNILDDEVFINGDYNRLSQVLINIIKNSIEVLEEGESGIINLSTHIKNNKYYLEIEDNGMGMDKETLDNIRKPFFTTKKRGSGLGIPLIYEIIEVHGGKVKYLSEYGKGTKVTIELPIYE